MAQRPAVVIDNGTGYALDLLRIAINHSMHLSHRRVGLWKPIVSKYCADDGYHTRERRLGCRSPHVLLLCISVLLCQVHEDGLRRQHRAQLHCP
jgi:hypothetical protein